MLSGWLFGAMEDIRKAVRAIESDLEERGGEDEGWEAGDIGRCGR